MPDPDANPNAKVPSIGEIQEACAKAAARLVFLPEGVDVDDTAVQFELANGRELKVPLRKLRTEKTGTAAIAEMVERLQKKAGE